MSVSKYMGVFLAGVACGTMSEKVFANPTVRKALVNATAAGLKVKDEVIEKAVALQENAGDIVRCLSKSFLISTIITMAIFLVLMVFAL